MAKNKASSRSQKIYRKLKNAQVTWNKFHNVKCLKRKTYNHQCIYYLVEESDKNYKVVRRFWDRNQKRSRYDLCEYQSLSVAKEKFEEFVSSCGRRKINWDSVDVRLAQAGSFIKRYKMNRKNRFSYYPLMKISFIFALSEKIDLGYKYKNTYGVLVQRGGEKSSNTKMVVQARSNIKRRLCGLFREYELNSSHPNKNNDLILEMFDLIVRDVRSQIGVISESTYRERSGVLLDVFKSLVDFPRAYPFAGSVVAFAKQAREKILKTNRFNGDVGSGTIVSRKSYAPIPLKDLKIILDQAYRRSPSLFNALIFELSQMLRPEEFWRLLKRKKHYIVNGCVLDYKSGELLTKTKRSTDVSKLVNPCLSVVSRIILYHGKMSFDSSFFKKIPGEYRHENEALKDYVFRNFRTTGATMLAYCSKIHGVGGSSLSEVQERLGHVTMQMSMNVYAKNCPDGIHPFRYFESIDPVITIDGVDVTRYSTYWDTWLLKTYLEKHKENLSEFEFKKMKKACVVESKKHDSYLIIKENDLTKLAF